MNKIWYGLLFLSLLASGCSPSELDSDTGNSGLDGSGGDNSDITSFEWTIPLAKINGSNNPFPLVKNPSLKNLEDVKFLDDDALVAMISFGNEIRVYPYDYIQSFESINDEMDGVNYAMTYCPITKSGLVWDRNFRGENFTIRASGYLYNDNLIAVDQKSDTYWSQMLATCVKGKYHGQKNKTHNFIETKWKTVKENFKDAKIFTNANTSSKGSSTKDELVDSESIYGIVDLDYSSNVGKGIGVYFYSYDLFENETRIYTNSISKRDVIIVGNKDLHFITSFILEGRETFTAVQNQFPIVMEDSSNNKWDIFGIAVQGPKKGHQLESLTGFVASGWAWKLFYKDYEVIE